VTCPQCGAPTLPHHVCMSCGTYRGVQIIELEED
jgi:large subunit ribosomal protein L32